MLPAMQVCGTLTITKRNLVLNTFDGEWVYDGLLHGNSGLGVVNGGYELVGHGLGDDLYSKITAENLIKDVGLIDNYITVKLYLDKECTDSNKVDERNYDISIGTTGTLEITPRPITIIAVSASKVYDDKPFIKDDDIRKEITQLKKKEAIHLRQ